MAITDAGQDSALSIIEDFRSARRSTWRQEHARDLEVVRAQGETREKARRLGREARVQRLCTEDAGRVLVAAAEQGNLENVEIMLGSEYLAGLDSVAYIRKAILHALRASQPQTLKKLIRCAKGSQILDWDRFDAEEKFDGTGERLLTEVAALRGAVEAAQILVKEKATLGPNTFHLLLMQPEFMGRPLSARQLEIAKLYLETGLQISRKDEAYKTARRLLKKNPADPLAELVIDRVETTARPSFFDRLLGRKTKAFAPAPGA